MSNETPPDSNIAKLLYPAEEEIAAGRAKLEACLPHWRTTPALFMSKPPLVVIVTVRSHSHDRSGFTLRLHADQTLVTTGGEDLEDYDVGCMWNQPYMYFDENIISAPYSFTLYFGAEGVANAREVHRLVSRGARPWDVMSVYHSCFEEDASKQIDLLRADLQEQSGGPA